MYIRNPDTNEWEEVFLPPTGDTLPVGSIVEYDGTKNIPTGWELVEDLGATKKIKKISQAVGLVGSVTTDINDTNDNAVPNAKTVKNYASKKVATANLSSAVTMTTGKISLNVINTSTSLLTLSDGGIKIGKGISKILINANVFGNAKGSNTSYLWIYIKKNQETIAIALNNPSSWYVSTALSSKLIDVAEGDVIWLYKQDDVSTEIRSGANTWLTVEVVE